MARMVRMTEYRMKELIYCSQAFGVTITFSGLDCSIITITNNNGTSYEMKSSLCYSSWYDYRMECIKVMNALSTKNDF